MAGYQSGFGNTFECPPRRTPPVRSCSGCRERPRRDWVIRESRLQRLSPSSIGRLSLAEWIGLNACVRGDSWSATSGAEQPAGKSNDSRPFRLRTQGAMPRCAHTSSTRSNSRGLHSRARGRRISARGYIASAPAWYARALDFSRITAHILSHRRDIARYIRISNPSRSRSTSSHRSARCHRRRPIRCDGIRWTTSVCAGRVAFAHR